MSVTDVIKGLGKLSNKELFRLITAVVKESLSREQADPPAEE